MAAVTLSTIESIECHATKKKWIIPDNLFEICEDEKFLQISASSYGLCNLLSHGTVGKKTQPEEFQWADFLAPQEERDYGPTRKG